MLGNGPDWITKASHMRFVVRFSLQRGQEQCTWEQRHRASYLRGSPVLPAGRDMGDDTRMALFAHVDAVHFNDALTWVKASDGRHSAFEEREIGSICQKTACCVALEML